jgi:hypothetical protein
LNFTAILDDCVLLKNSVPDVHLLNGSSTTLYLPSYEPLDREIREDIKEISKNIILADETITYGCPPFWMTTSNHVSK